MASRQDYYFQSLLNVGADPRSATALAADYAKRYTQARLAYNRARYYKRRSSRGWGALSKVRSVFGLKDSYAQMAQVSKDFATTMAEQRQLAQERIKTEIETQPLIQQKKERRKKVTERIVQSMEGSRGKAALLESPRGGRGFFGGYFEGQ